MEPTLLLAATIDLVAAVLFAFVGWTLHARAVSPDGRRARTSFTVWWGGVAIIILIKALREFAGAFGMAGDPVVVAWFTGLHYVNLAALCASVFGLLYYLVYLYTGSRRAFWPLATFYAVYFVAVVALVARAGPIHLVVEDWNVRVAYAEVLAERVWIQVLLLFLLLPQIVAALAYGSLYFRLQDPAQRARVGLVASALVVWLGLGLLAPLTGFGATDWWQAGGRLVGLAAASVILVAYRPPGWLRDRLGMRAPREEVRG